MNNITKFDKIYTATYYCQRDRCDKCPYNDDKKSCFDRLNKDTLDLLNAIGKLLNYCDDICSDK